MRRKPFLLLSLLFLTALPSCKAQHEKKLIKPFAHDTVDVSKLKRSAETRSTDDLPIGWLADCNRRIKGKLTSKESLFANRELSCYFRLSKTGGVSEVKITKTSGDNSVDQSAIEAIKTAAMKFRPIDSSVPFSKGLKVDFHGINLQVKPADSNSQ